MQSIFNIRTLAVLAMGALAGGREAIAWCPTASDKTISCSNCTVTLSCTVSGLGAIVIGGNNVTFDGNWNSIEFSTQSAIQVVSDQAIIKNLHIYSPAVTGINVISGTGDWLQLQNVYVSGGYVGLAHYYEGTLAVYSSSFENSQIGYYAGYGSPTSGGYADSYYSSFAYNSNHGMYLSGKPLSYSNANHSYLNDGHGVYVEYSPNSWLWENYVYHNDVSGRNGLRLANSNNSRIEGNYGWANGSYDCITTSSSGVSASGNSWSSYSGSCN